MSCVSIQCTPTLRFFVLVYALSIPWWLLALFVRQDGLPDNLPVTDVGATFMPMLAAALRTFSEGGMTGVKALFARLFDWGRIGQKRWLAVAVLLMPGLYTLTYVMMSATGLKVPHVWSPSPMLLLIFLAFFTAAVGEEIGYTGYATDKLQQRWSALATALIIGMPWALWHLPSMIQLGQSPRLIALGLAVTVASRVIYLWIYNKNGQSLFVVTLFHAIANIGRTAFPGGRPAYELGDGVFSYGLIIALAALVAMVAQMKKRPSNAQVG